MAFERDGKEYIRHDGKDIECLPKFERDLMEKDFEGYLKWKKEQLKKNGHKFEDTSSIEYVSSTDEEIEEYKKQADEIMAEMDKLWDETYARWEKEDAEED